MSGAIPLLPLQAFWLGQEKTLPLPVLQKVACLSETVCTLSGGTVAFLVSNTLCSYCSFIKE